MITTELFSGTGSFSRVALDLGHSIRTYDLADHADELVPNTHTQSNILDRGVSYPHAPDILWSSPPCTTFSIASCSTHWNVDGTPKSEAALVGMQILERTLELIAELRPKYWFLENPRGMMRKRIDPLLEKYGLRCTRHTVTYCQYGDDRMKPTDIWTNMEWQPRPMCKNGMPCHTAAPRGAKTGTQGLKGARARSIIPPEIFREIFQQLEDQR